MQKKNSDILTRGLEKCYRILTYRRTLRIWLKNKVVFLLGNKKIIIIVRNNSSY